MIAEKLSSEQMVDLFREEAFYDENDVELFEVVETGDWSDGGKFSSAKVIFQDNRTGKFYSYEIIRSGSYFSHYEYEAWDKPVEVEKQERTITITEWVGV
jgi:hypothetical protein